MAATAAAPLPAGNTYLPIDFQLGPIDGAHPISKSDVVTLLVNPTTATRTYSYLPLHGRDIASKGTLLLKGDLVSYLSNNLRYSRKLNGLLNDTQLGNLLAFVNHRVLLSVNAASGTVINTGDLVYLASGSGLAASAFTWDTDTATTQAEFKAVFVGIAVEPKASTSAAQQLLVDISPTSCYYMSCTSETHEVGDTMGPAKDTGNTLVSNKLVKAVATSSIARVVQRDASAATKVVVRFQSELWGHNTSAAQ